MMEQKQLIDTMMIAMDHALANLHTATIAKITKVDAQTVNCIPVVARVVNDQAIQLPEFQDVPPLFLQGGGSYLAHPVAVGDYCLLIFTERCFDQWYGGGDFIRPTDARMHDYSDGFAIVGINPLGSAITIPTETTMTGITRMGITAPTDFMALAGLVLGELNSVKSDLDSFKTVFDAHVHGAAGAAPPAVPFPAPHTPASVASVWVEAE